MNKIYQGKNIEILTAKIKELQEELFFRTRNYLYQNSSSRRRQIETKSKIIQTQQVIIQNHPNQQSQLKSKESTVYKSYLVFQQSYTPQKHDIPFHHPSSPISEFIQQNNPTQRNHETLCKLQTERQILKKLQFQQQTPFAKLQKSMIIQPQPINNEISLFEYNKIRRKLNKQIKNLKRRLQIEENMNKYMKRGLLISQQQNYQFRLKIKKLQKIVRQSQIKQSDDMSEVSSENVDDRLKNQKINLLQEQFAHQKKVKQQYLDSLLAAQDKISTLQLQVQKLTKEHHQINLQLRKNRQRRFQNIKIIPQNQQQVNKKEQTQKIWINESFLQQLKEKSYSISNCIPIVNDKKDVNLFMPQTEEEIMASFNRIEDYCKNIQKWELKRLSQLDQQRQVFISFLKKISQHIDNQSKQKISRQIIKIQKMGYLLKIFKPSSLSQQILQQSKINTQQIFNQQNEKIMQNNRIQFQQKETVIC